MGPAVCLRNVLWPATLADNMMGNGTGGKEGRPVASYSPLDSQRQGSEAKATMAATDISTEGLQPTSMAETMNATIHSLQATLLLDL